MSGPAFEWKLRELMAMREMFSTSDLIEPLAERGVLSRSQVYRLVADTPERVTIPLLLALVRHPRLPAHRPGGTRGSGAGSREGSEEGRAQEGGR